MKSFRLQVLMPLGFFLASLGYMVFVMGMEVTRMAGDTRGYDPGGRMVPLLAAAVMGGLSLFLMLKELFGGGAKEESRTPFGLTAVYIAVSAAYILLFRHLGYMLSTSFLLFWLTLLNLKATGADISWPRAFVWMVAALIYIICSYSAIRVVIRSMYRVARIYGLPAAREPVVQAFAVTLIVGALFLLVGKALSRLTRSPELTLLLQSSIGTTIAVYISFRLLFLVQLPNGLLNW